MNLTFNQMVAFGVAVCSFLAAGGSAADLTTLVGSTGAHVIQAGASVAAGIGGIFLGFVTGQANVVKDVRAMPGVENIVVNAKANPTLAAIAVDPKEDKVLIAPGAEAVVAKTASGS